MSSNGANMPGTTIKATEALNAHTICKLSGAMADATEQGHGVVLKDTASGAFVTLHDRPGTLLHVKANGNSVAIAAGDFLKATTDGVAIKAATDGDKVILQARQALDADGKLIEAMVLSPFTLSVPG